MDSSLARDREPPLSCTTLPSHVMRWLLWLAGKFNRNLPRRAAATLRFSKAMLILESMTLTCANAQAPRLCIPSLNDRNTLRKTLSTLTLESILNPAPLAPSRHITQADSSAVPLNHFNLPAPLKQRLAAANFVIPTPVQAGAIPPALEGADILA